MRLVSSEACDFQHYAVGVVAGHSYKFVSQRRGLLDGCGCTVKGVCMYVCVYKYKQISTYIYIYVCMCVCVSIYLPVATI